MQQQVSLQNTQKVGVNSKSNNKKEYLLEYMALNERGVNCLREVFEIFLKFNKILCFV